jgi:hypothetical protein
MFEWPRTEGPALALELPASEAAAAAAAFSRHDRLCARVVPASIAHKVLSCRCSMTTPDFELLETSFCALDQVAALPRLLSNDEAEAL